MNKKEELLKDHLKELEQISKSSLNENQKELIKLNLEILKNNDKISIDDFEQIWRFLKQRVATGFVFDEAPEINNQSIAILEKDEKLSFSSSKMKDNLQNSLIIGENYDVLKNLIGVEREREDANFDLIYIDPPYNTQKTSDDGNNLTDDEITADKFIYRDKFSRTGWLNLLNERLKLAKQLLKEDGVIFVSIDDNEQAYLKVLMDEIFGEENFVANIVWRKSSIGSHKDIKDIKTVNVVNEYIVTYAKKKTKLRFDYVRHSQEKLDKEYKLKDDNFEQYGYYRLERLAYKGLDYQASLDYELEAPDGTKFRIYQNIKKPQTMRYIWSKELFDYANSLNLVEIKKTQQGNWVAYKKVYQYAKFDARTKQFILVEKGVPFTNMIIANQNNLHLNILTEQGSKEMTSIFKDKMFDYPKPVELVKYLIKMASSKKDIRILDFFAGSGTTAQAVLELNKEDGGRRSFVLVTNNENNIGQNVTYERLYRINKGQGTKGQKDFEWIKKNEAFDTSLNVFWSNTYNTSLLNNNITNKELKDKFLKLLKDFGINKDTEKFDNSVLKTLSSLRPYKEENEEK